jgi:DNA-binding CsgD family transcriptional regulator
VSTVGSAPWPANAHAFFDEAAALMLAGDPRVRLLGPTAEAEEHIDRRAAEVEASVWNIQASSTIHTVRASLEMAQRHPTDHRDSRDVISRATLEACPLFPSVIPDVRVGSVPGPMLITDESHAFLAGPSGTRLAQTIWATTDPGLVAWACRVFHALWDAARPASEVSTRPLLPPRRARVALLLAEGASDLEISRALGISARTASAEVAEVVRWCGARSRGHAIAVIVGADR